jgi:hypothetical protein
MMDADAAFDAAAERVYQRILPSLKGQEGKIVAIEVESGDYFVGADIDEAYRQAAARHPGKLFFFKRVGFRSVYFMGGAGWRRDIFSASPS